MSCPLDAELSALLEGDLPPSHDRRIRSHIIACRRCHESFESLAALRRSLGTLPSLSPVDQFEPLWRQLHADSEKQPGQLAWRIARHLGQRGGRWTLAAIGAGLGCALLLEAHLPHPSGMGDDEIVANAERAFRHADLDYQAALAKLKKASGRAKLRLVEKERRKFEAALSELESATDRCRQAALGRPSDPEAEEMLFSAYRRQIHFFEDQLLAASSP
jgi:hypothetical protein